MSSKTCTSPSTPSLAAKVSSGQPAVLKTPIRSAISPAKALGAEIGSGAVCGAIWIGEA